PGSSFNVSLILRDVVRLQQIDADNGIIVVKTRPSTRAAICGRSIPPDIVSVRSLPIVLLKPIYYSIIAHLVPQLMKLGSTAYNRIIRPEIGVRRIARLCRIMFLKQAPSFIILVNKIEYLLSPHSGIHRLNRRRILDIRFNIGFRSIVTTDDGEPQK